ncbi:MAG: NADH-quinone oxidoreductase subunit M, partial [Candidatus Hodarchaeota archaeon]
MLEQINFSDLNIGILTLIFLLPIVAAFPTWLVGRVRNELSKWFALIVSALVMLLSIVALMWYEQPATGSWDLTENIRWIEAIGMNYSLGVDGLSLPLVLLSGFIFLVAVLASFKEIHEREPAYYAMILLLETGVMGTFLATDFVIFYVAWELV